MKCICKDKNMAGIKIYKSDNINRLVSRLADNIVSNNNSGSFFNAPIHKIVIPSLVNKSWLNYELLNTGKMGTLFNIEYDTFDWSPYRIIKNLGGKHLDQTATEKDLFFEIITVLDNEDFMSNPDMIPVKNYISDKFENIAREKKYTFATKLASLFVKYIDSNISDIEKPAQDDIIGKWNNILGKGIKEDNFEPLEFIKNNWDKIKEDNKDLFSSPASKFEFLIYTEILKPKIKKILDNETDTNISRLAILNKFDIESIKNSAEKDKIKLYVFNYPYLTPGNVDLLGRFAEVIDIYVYINTVNDNLCENILGSSDNIQTKYINNIEKLDTEIIDLDTKHEKLNVLNSLKYGFEDKISQDTSFQIMACPGKYREAECVYNSVVWNLEHNDNLKPEEIGVILCDSNDYYSAVNGVFLKHPHKIPVNFVSAVPNVDNLYIDAVEKLCKLTDGNFTRDLVKEFFENPCVLKKIRKTEKDLDDFMNVADKFNIWAFFDKDQKDEYFKNDNMNSLFTWQNTAKNLRLGKIIDQSDSSGIWNEICPQKVTEDVSVFFRVIEKIYTEYTYSVQETDNIIQKIKTSQPVSQSPAYIVNRFRDFINTFIEDVSENNSVRILIENSLKDYEIQTEMRQYYPKFMEIYEYLKKEASQSNYKKGKTFVGGVIVGRLFNMRLNNFKVIYIMGLNQGVFPGEDDRSSLDLQRDFPGISKTQEDKYALLKLINNTQQKVYLSYDCLDTEKDAEKYASGTLDEIREYISQNILNKDFQISEMPLLGKSFKYYKKENDFSDVYVNYSLEDYSLAKYDILKSQPKEEELEDLIFDETNENVLVPDDDFIQIKASEIGSFLVNPCDYGLDRLGIKKEYDNSEDYVFEPLKLKKFADSNLINEAITDLIEEKDFSKQGDVFDRVFEEYKNRGQIPSEPLCSINKNNLKKTYDTFIDNFIDSNTQNIYSNVIIGDRPDNYRDFSMQFDPVCIYQIPNPNRSYPFGLKNVHLAGTIPFLKVEGNTWTVIFCKTGNFSEKTEFELKILMLMLYLIKKNEAEISVKGLYLCKKPENKGISQKNYEINTDKYKDTENNLKELTNIMQSESMFEILPKEICKKIEDTENSEYNNKYLETLSEKLNDEYGYLNINGIAKDLAFNFKILDENDIIRERISDRINLTDNLITEVKKGKKK